ncbi:MAG: type IV secretion system protein [Sphaerochaeta sp.]|nr:type IV secretion system protein [Sphaerochaeta sp.]
MAESSLTEGIFMILVNNYNTYFFHIYDDLMANFGIFFRTMMVLYTVLIGYMWMTNKENSRAFIKSWFLIAIFYTLVMESNAYMNTVYSPFIGLVEDISTYFLQGTSYTSVFASLDELAVKFIQTTGSLWPSGINWPWDYALAVIGFVALYVFFFVMVFAFLAVYAISYFSICLFLLLGGVFILLGTIEHTKSMFFAWLKNLLQHAFTIIFASIILGVTSDGVLNSINDLEQLDMNNIFSLKFVGFIGWCAINTVLFLKSADFAAGLTGTIAGSTAGLAGGMAKAGGLTAAGTAGAGALGAHGGLAGAGYLAGKAGMTRTQAMAGNALEMLKKKRGIK